MRGKNNRFIIILSKAASGSIFSSPPPCRNFVPPFYRLTFIHLPSSFKSLSFSLSPLFPIQKFSCHFSFIASLFACILNSLAVNCHSFMSLLPLSLLDTCIYVCPQSFLHHSLTVSFSLTLILSLSSSLKRERERMNCAPNSLCVHFQSLCCMYFPSSILASCILSYFVVFFFCPFNPFVSYRILLYFSFALSIPLFLFRSSFCTKKTCFVCSSLGVHRRISRHHWEAWFKNKTRFRKHDC